MSMHSAKAELERKFAEATDHQERRMIKQILDWLKFFAQKMQHDESDDDRLQCLASMYVRDLRTCDCAIHEELPGQLGDYYHGLYNRALREILDDHGKTEPLRRQLRITLKHERFSCFEQEDGRRVLKHFLAAWPDPVWIGRDS